MMESIARARRGSVSAATSHLKLQQMLTRPAYIFRGHSSAVHVVRFFRDNLVLLTADADGWVVLWNLVSRRPAIVWRAHQSSILGAAEWGAKVITHGRDSRLCVWEIPADLEAPTAFSTVLPADEEGTDLERPKPPLVHSLLVNTLNFCPFAACSAQMQEGIVAGPETRRASHARKTRSSKEQDLTCQHTSDPSQSETLFVAVPAQRDGEIDLYQLPSEQWVTRIPAPHDKTAGMVMQIRTHENVQTAGPRKYKFSPVTVVAAFENGSASVFIGYRIPKPVPVNAVENIGNKWAWTWREVYTSTPHGAPVLGLDVSVHSGRFFTSGADNVVAMHDLPKPQPPSSKRPSLGTSSLPATLSSAAAPAARPNPPSLLSQAFQSAPVEQAAPEERESSPSDIVPTQAPIASSKSLAELVTDFVGQQDLTLRPSDHDILATAGWDGSVHLYKPKTLTHLDDLSAPFLANGVDCDDGGGGWIEPAPESALARGKEATGKQNGLLTVAFSRVVHEFIDEEEVRNGGGHEIASVSVIDISTAAAAAAAGGPAREGGGAASPKSVQAQPFRRSGLDRDGSEFGQDEPGGYAYVPSSSSVMNSAAGFGSMKERRQVQIQKRAWVAAGSKDGRVLLWEMPESRWKNK